MTLDYALRLYTDMVHNGEEINLLFFQKELNPEDYNEFLELIPFINIIKSTSVNNKFKKLFKEMNDYKIELEKDTASVVNFRKEEDSDTEEAKRIFDDAFKEEFDD